jgi:hypothetical protein
VLDVQQALWKSSKHTGTQENTLAGHKTRWQDRKVADSPENTLAVLQACW